MKKLSLCLVIFALILSAFGSVFAEGESIAVLVPSADHGWTGAVLNYANEKADELNAEGYKVTVLASTDPKNQQEGVSKYHQ